jgi:hypothetical protein
LSRLPNPVARLTALMWDTVATRFYTEQDGW